MKAKSYAKVNIFLKITGTKEFNGRSYHTLNSRFMIVEDLYDIIEFVPQKCDSFTIEGIDEVKREDNIIYKAYKALNLHIGDLDILDFFYNHKVVVKKQIPFGAGLGGGSSNAATFMKMVKEVCNLKVSIEELANIGATIGADVPFFIYGYNSANVSGFGEIIEEFKEEPLHLNIITPPIECNTAKIYSHFRENFLKNLSKTNGDNLLKLKSKDILSNAKSADELNDLYKSAIALYPNLLKYKKDRYFFSGSGSSFFKMV